MTTSPVTSVTDELIAELGRECEGSLEIIIGRRTMRALLTEREELKRDADRYRWLRDTGPRLVIECPLIAMCNSDGSVVRRDHGSEMLLSGDSADAAIDAAMQS